MENRANLIFTRLSIGVRIHARFYNVDETEVRILVCELLNDVAEGRYGVLHAHV